jgi:hypothetical protein
MHKYHRTIEVIVPSALEMATNIVTLVLHACLSLATVNVNTKLVWHSICATKGLMICAHHHWKSLRESSNRGISHYKLECIARYLSAIKLVQIWLHRWYYRAMTREYIRSAIPKKLVISLLKTLVRTSMGQSITELVPQFHCLSSIMAPGNNSSNSLPKRAGHNTIKAN